MSKEQYTPLVGTKWTKARMLKVHDMLLSSYIDDMLNQVRFSNTETVRRMKISCNWIKRIRELCNNNDIAFKKKEDKDKKEKK
jgi:hypothetical protein